MVMACNTRPQEPWCTVTTHDIHYSFTFLGKRTAHRSNFKKIQENSAALVPLGGRKILNGKSIISLYPLMYLCHVQIYRILGKNCYEFQESLFNHLSYSHLCIKYFTILEYNMK